jgi:hypothetical protein
MFFAFLKVLLAGKFLSFDYKINPKKNQRPAVFFTHFNRPRGQALCRPVDGSPLFTRK